MLRLRPIARRLTTIGVGAALLSAASACGGGTNSSLAGVAGATHTPSPRLTAGTLVVNPHEAVGPVAVDAHDLVWESGPLEDETSVSPSLHDRDFATGSTRTFPGAVDPLFGLASTSRFVFFARSTGNGATVVRTTHRGSDADVLTKTLVTPIASRGNVVAWGEQSGQVQRVVAYEGAGTKPRVVAKMSRCTGAVCYRLDDVTVADRGVVFTRDAVGGQGSLVVRRAFDESKAQSITVKHDPQPDLEPSSSGALYYDLFHGWYRWDFGDSRPRPVTFANSPLKQLIRHEGPVWYWLDRHDCSVRIESSRGGDAAALNVPKRLAQIGSEPGGTCTELGGLTWAGTHAIAAWAVASEAAEEDHSDAGLRGVVVSARVPPK